MREYISEGLLIALVVILGITFFASNKDTSVKTSLESLLKQSSTQVSDLSKQIK